MIADDSILESFQEIRAKVYSDVLERPSGVESRGDISVLNLLISSYLFLHITLACYSFNLLNFTSLQFMFCIPFH